MILTVTLTIAALAGALNLWLASRLILARVKGNILIGDGGQPGMASRMRAHANFVEYTPFVLILMGLIELSGGTHTVLWALGSIYLVVRVMHPIGMDIPASNLFRAGGAIGTWLILAMLSGWALLIVTSIL